jgi:hypothetical protein
MPKMLGSAADVDDSERKGAAEQEFVIVATLNAMATKLLRNFMIVCDLSD